MKVKFETIQDNDIMYQALLRIDTDEGVQYRRDIQVPASEIKSYQLTKQEIIDLNISTIIYDMFEYIKTHENKVSV